MQLHWSRLTTLKYGIVIPTLSFSDEQYWKWKKWLSCGKKNLQLWSVVISENSVSIPSVLYIIYLHSIFKYTSILQTNIITKPAKRRLRETWRRTRRLLRQMMSLRSTTEELKPCHLLLVIKEERENFSNN